jgi:hypothetical protein
MTMHDPPPGSDTSRQSPTWHPAGVSVDTRREQARVFIFGRLHRQAASSSAGDKVEESTKDTGFRPLGLSYLPLA